MAVYEKKKEDQDKASKAKKLTEQAAKGEGGPESSHLMQGSSDFKPDSPGDGYIQHQVDFLKAVQMELDYGLKTLKAGQATLKQRQVQHAAFVDKNFPVSSGARVPPQSPNKS